MHKLQAGTCPPVVHSSKIAATFRDYCAHLYHLPATLPGLTVDQKQGHILDYLTEAQAPHLPAQTSKSLEAPITQEELEIVVKGLLNDKSPGPDGYTKAYYCAFLSFLSGLCALILTP